MHLFSSGRTRDASETNPKQKLIIMARFKPIEILKTLSGKVCSHSNIFFANKKYGTRYTVKICNPRTKPFTAAELARQARFKAAHDALLALTAEQKATYAEAFSAQHKYKTLNGYILAQEYAKLQGGGN